MKKRKPYSRKTALAIALMLLIGTCCTSVQSFAESANGTLKKVTMISVTRSGLEKVKVKWKNISNESGYQISMSAGKNKTNVVYTYKTTKGSNVTLTAKLNKTYYYKVRAYKTGSHGKIYGKWSKPVKYTVSKKYYPKAVRINKNGAALDITKASGQKQKGYDIFQGSCTDGTYGYYVLYNKKLENCKIAKVRLSDNRITKVSKVLKIHHGNDLTYNNKTKKILAVHLTGPSKTIAVIDPVSLKLEKNRTIKIPAKLSSATRSKLKAITGFNAIAYDKSKDQYVLRTRNSGDYLIVDKNFKPIKYITPNPKKYKSRIYAGLDIINGYIASAEASSNTGTFSRYNVVRLFTWSGKYAGCIYIRKGYELESVFNADGTGYSTYYREYYVNKKMHRKNYIYKFKI